MPKTPRLILLVPLHMSSFSILQKWQPLTVWKTFSHFTEEEPMRLGFPFITKGFVFYLSLFYYFIHTHCLSLAMVTPFNYKNFLMHPPPNFGPSHVIVVVIYNIQQVRKCKYTVIYYLFKL